MSPCVTPLVQSLNDALTVYDASHPDVIAYELLQLGTDAPEPLSLDAAERWSRVLDKNPDDAVAAHHLAVIHHGLAYQLHGDPLRRLDAVAHWEAGLSMWGQVIARDEFWAHLQAAWRDRHEQGKGDLLAERLLKVDLRAIRRQLPQFLLDIHVAILQTVFPGQVNLAREHLRLVRRAPFADEYRQRALKNIYQGLAGGPVSSMLEDLKTREALSLIESYLLIDPDNLAALADGLKVATKHAERLKADGATFVQTRHCMASAVEWANRLEKQLQATPDLLLADSARTFFLEYARMLSNHGVNQANAGHAAEGIDFVFEALDPCSRALRLEKGGQEARSFYIHICEQISILSINVEGSEQRAYNALSTADRVLPRQPLILARLSYIAAVLDKPDSHRQYLQQAEQCQQAAPDQRAAPVIAELRQKGLGVAAGKLLGQAVKAMEAKNFWLAQGLLKQADARDPGNPLILIIWAYCHVSLGDLPSCRTALNAAVRAQRTRPNPEAAGLITSLSSQLASIG